MPGVYVSGYAHMHTFRSHEILGILCCRSLPYSPWQHLSLNLELGWQSASLKKQSPCLCPFICPALPGLGFYVGTFSNLYSKCSYPLSHLCSPTSVICKQQPRMLTLKIRAMLHMDFACLTRSGIITRVSALILFNMEAQSRFAWSY